MYYFFRGLSLIHTKGLKRFVLVPLSINLVLFSFAFYFLLQQVNALVAAVQQIKAPTFSLTLDHLACFAKPKILYLAPSVIPDALLQLQQQLDKTQP